MPATREVFPWLAQHGNVPHHRERRNTWACLLGRTPHRNWEEPHEDQPSDSRQVLHVRHHPRTDATFRPNRGGRPFARRRALYDLANGPPALRCAAGVDGVAEDATAEIFL